MNALLVRCFPLQHLAGDERRFVGERAIASGCGRVAARLIAAVVWLYHTERSNKHEARGRKFTDMTMGMSNESFRLLVREVIEGALDVIAFAPHTARTWRAYLWMTHRAPRGAGPVRSRSASAPCGGRGAVMAQVIERDGSQFHRRRSN